MVYLQMVEASVKFAIGDLVTPTNGEGCDLFNDECAEKFPHYVRDAYTGYEMRSGEIGTILEIKRVNTNITSDNLFKILCSGGGVGWVYQHWMEKVK